MIVVSDTTPLISLLKIVHLDLLEKLFGQVLIPKAVFDELTVDERYKLEANQIRRKEFIIVKSVQNSESASLLKRATGLDKGESEAIVLTAISFQMGFKVMGTIGVLMAAYEEKELTADEIRECVEGLQNAGRHISQKHYQMLLDRIRN